MRYIVTTTEFEFHERVYIIDAEDAQEALAAVHRDDTKPLIDSIARKKVIDPSVELLVDHPSYIMIRKAAGIATGEKRTSLQRAGHSRHVLLKGNYNGEGESSL